MTGSDNGTVTSGTPDLEPVNQCHVADKASESRWTAKICNIVQSPTLAHTVTLITNWSNAKGMKHIWCLIDDETRLKAPRNKKGEKERWDTFKKFHRISFQLVIETSLTSARINIRFYRNNEVS